MTDTLDTEIRMLVTELMDAAPQAPSITAIESLQSAPSTPRLVGGDIDAVPQRRSLFCATDRSEVVHISWEGNRESALGDRAADCRRGTPTRPDAPVRVHDTF